jgi:hypothetical protein
VNDKGTGATAGYGQNDIGFVYRPTWYTGPENDIVEAAYLNQPDFFIAGHWRNRVAVQGQSLNEKNENVTLIGLEAGFRDPYRLSFPSSVKRHFYKLNGLRGWLQKSWN